MSLKLLKQIRINQDEEIILIKNISSLRASVHNISFLAENPMANVEDNYSKLYEDLRVLGKFHDVRETVQVERIAEGEDIGFRADQSIWAGIKKVTLKVDFYEMAGMDQYLSVFHVLEAIEKNQPLSIVLINQSGKALEMMVDVYGK